MTRVRGGYQRMIEKSWFRNKCRRPEATLEEILPSLVRVALECASV